MFQQFFFNEVSALRNMFMSNGYPLYFLKNCFKKFNENIFAFPF